MKSPFLAVLGIVCYICPCARSGEPENPFPPLHSDAVVSGAGKTWRSYAEWQTQAKGTSVQGDLEIPPHLWDQSLAKLKPEYVYVRKLDIVIVLRQVDGNEEGLYVVQMISSVPCIEGHPFTHILISRDAGGELYAFRREGNLRRLPKPRQDKQ